jgi:hypothetical protein
MPRFKLTLFICLLAGLSSCQLPKGSNTSVLQASESVSTTPEYPRPIQATSTPDLEPCEFVPSVELPGISPPEPKFWTLERYRHRLWMLSLSQKTRVLCLICANIYCHTLNEADSLLDLTAE